jgi:hypothetical protein
LDETPYEKTKRYLVLIEKVLGEMKLSSLSSIDERQIKGVVSSAALYAEDAKHYLEERPSTALAAISYAEGLLDALRFLGLARFTWPDSRGDRH